ncbi:membrane protein, partial [gut metagenome]
MFTIRDWTLKEQHNLTVTGLSAAAGFFASLLLLNSFAVTDLNLRSAVSISALLFAGALGFRERHFPDDPLKPVGFGPDLLVACLGFAFLASLLTALEALTLAGAAIPLLLYGLFLGWLLRTRPRSILQQATLTPADLNAVTAQYIRIAMPSARPQIKAIYAKAIDRATAQTPDAAPVNRLSGEARQEALRAHCLKEATLTLRTVIAETLADESPAIND